MEQHEDTVARGKANEALQAIRSLQNIMDVKFAEVWRRFDDSALATTNSETRTNQSQVAGESRLKGEMSAIEGRLLFAINELKTAMNTQTAQYSNRFWDTTTKIVGGLIAALWAVAYAYSSTKR